MATNQLISALWMEERKKRFEDKNEVRGRMADVVKKLAAGATFFDGTHIFTPHSDVPDDGALRLVVLPSEQLLFPRGTAPSLRRCIRLLAQQRTETEVSW
jgi:hypothetical protein